MLPLYGNPSQNLAPLAPFTQLREKNRPSHYLTDALKERFQHYVKKNETERKEILASAQELSLFLQGNHFIAYNPYSGTWRAMTPVVLNSETRRALNLMQYFVSKWISKWEQSNPDILIKPAFEDDFASAAASACDLLYDRYERLFYPAFNTQAQGLACFTFGNYLMRVRHNQDAQGAVLYREIFEDQTIQLDEGYGRCACGYEGTYQEFQGQDDSGPVEACPHCGSGMVMTTPPTQETVPVPVGQERINLGEIELESLPFAGSYWDFTTRAHLSSYFIYRQNVRAGKIRALLGDVEIPGEPDASDFGLKILKALAHSGSAVSGQGQHGRSNDQASWRDDVTVDEMWLSPEDYNDIKIKGDEMTLSGVPLPAGKKLVDVFPEKLCAIGLNGMALLGGLFPETHKDYLASGICHMKPQSGVGRNGADLIEPQKRFNKFDEQLITAFDAFGSPGYMYAKDAVEPEHANFIGKPNTAIPYDPTRYANLTGTQFAFPLQPSVVSPAMMQYGQVTLKEVMQFTSHIIDNTTGVPNVDIETLGGQELLAQSSDALFTPVLRVKAEVALEIAKKATKLVKKVFPQQAVARLLGRDGESKAEAFFAVDIDEALIFTVQKDSETPRNTYTQRKEYVAFYQSLEPLGGLEMALAKFPSLVRQNAALWGVKLDSDNPDEIALKCRKRLQQMIEGLQSGILDPAALVALVNPPVSIAEPYHQAKMTWFSEWLDSDAAWKPEMLPVRMAVELLCQTHFQAQGALSAFAAQQAGQIAGEAMNAQESESPQESNLT